MRKGLTEQAGALSARIGKAIEQYNSNWLKNSSLVGGGDGSVDIKLMWQRVNHLMGKREGVQNSPPHAITASSLNTHYAQVSHDPSYKPAPVLSLNASCEDSDPSWLTDMRVFYALDKLKNTATGPDELPAWYLKLSAPAIATPLAHVMRLCLSQSFVPPHWRMVLIKPIPKIPNH